MPEPDTIISAYLAASDGDPLAALSALARDAARLEAERDAIAEHLSAGFIRAKPATPAKPE